MSTKIINGINLLIYFTLDVTDYEIEEVTADHPEVLSMINETVKMAKDMNFEQPHEKIAEIFGRKAVIEKDEAGVVFQNKKQ